MALPMVVEGIELTLAIGSYTPKCITLGLPGIEGGDPIDTTTTENSAWITKMARSLKEATDIPFTMFYEADDWDTIAALVNVNSQIVFTIPRHGSLTIWGYLSRAESSEEGVGEGMKAQCNIVVTNTNGSYAETAPVFAAS